jgi:hypothetical protein
MAVNEYIQAAAGQLESAANAVRMEIDRMRGDFMGFEQQATRQLTSKEADMRAAVARASTADNPAAVAHHSGQAAMLRKEITDLKQEIEQRRRELQDQVRGKEGAIQGLMSQARGLQGMAGNFR